MSVRIANSEVQTAFLNPFRMSFERYCLMPRSHREEDALTRQKSREWLLRRQVNANQTRPVNVYQAPREQNSLAR